MKNKYYYIHIDEDEGEVAKVSSETEIEFIDEIINFDELPFKFIVENGDLQDYQSNELSWNLFSKRLYDILNYYICNGFKWVESIVLDSCLNAHRYYILCPLKSFDVLDADKTLFAGGDFIVKAVFDKKKIHNYKIFYISGSSLRLVVHQKIKDIISKSKCTGIKFSKAKMS